jgi:NAD+ diphosphatase
MNSETPDAVQNPSLFIFDLSPEGNVLIDAIESLPPRADNLEKFEGALEQYGRTSRTGDSDLWALVKPDFRLQEGYVFTGRRGLPQKLGCDLYKRSGIAFQMMSLYAKNKYCGVCGNPMTDHECDRARFCTACGNTVYPALSSAVIVAIEKDGMLLMGHNVNFPKNRYSILAGFVEPGETLEDALSREVYEESRISVKNIRYFGSQPWPFPNSMMFGFQADWESGEPTPDEGELSDVRWFTPSDLPDLPPSVSIARKLIDNWLLRVSKR